jgi:hypothetical protein
MWSIPSVYNASTAKLCGGRAENVRSLINADRKQKATDIFSLNKTNDACFILSLIEQRY